MVCSRLTLVAGGRSRAESVRLGVEALPLQCVQVLVHDAARPFVEAETIDAVVARVREGDVVLAAMPVADTLKRVNEVQQLVTATIPRSGLWQAQTPQGFPRALAERLFRSAGVENATDESMLAEALDIPVRVIRGSPANFKVTSAEDLRLAEAWAAASR